MVNKLILNIPYYIISLVGTGAIVNVIYIGILDFLFVLLLIKLFDKFQNSDIIDVSEYLGGKIFKWIIGIISIIIFFIVAFITLSDFTNILQKIYFSEFPLIYILLFFIAGICIANLTGLRAISRTTCFIIPLTLVSILITVFGIWGDFNIENFTPIFGHDFSTTFVLGASNCFSMYIIVYFYFIKPLLRESVDFKKIVLTSYGMSWLLLLLTIIPVMTLFNVNVTTEPLNALYLIARKIELGNFIQRTDAFFIFLWILSIFCYLSIVVFMINRTMKKLFKVSNEKMLTFSNCSILFGLTILPLNISQLRFIENTLYRYTILIVIFGIGITIMILANLKFKLKGKKKV
jgi:spore germination protein (amino acid permease)